MSIVTIDIGASYLKFATWELEGLKLLSSHRKPFPKFDDAKNAIEREVDAVPVLETVRETLNQLLRESPEVQGIYFSGQMHGHLLWKREGGAQSRFITWQDQRTLQPVQGRTAFEILRKALTPEGEAAIGHEVRPGHCATQLTHRKLKGELAAQVYPLALADYVACELTGSDPVTDPSNASAHGLYHLGKQDWHWDLIDRLGLQDLLWPRIGRTGQILGHYQFEGREIPVHLPIGDQQASLMGALLTPDELSLNIATGSQTSTLVSDWRSSESGPGSAQIRPFIANHFLKTVTHIPAGRAMNALVSLITECARNLCEANLESENVWSYVWREAQNAEGPLPQVNLSFFPSAIGSEGALTHLTESNMKVGHIARAALESMTENYWEISRRLSPTHHWKRLVLSGGMTRKVPLLSEMLARKFQLTARFSPHKEDALFGLVVLAVHEEHRHTSWEKTFQEVNRSL